MFMQKESKFQELIRLQQTSGLTVKDFCSNEGIAYSTFYYWRKKLQGNSGKSDFIPLVVKSPGSILSQGQSRSSRDQGFKPDQMTEDHLLLELVYPNGTLLRIKNDLDLAHLRALIHLYD
jgi:hypothetical protein